MQAGHDFRTAYCRLNETLGLALPDWGFQDPEDYKFVKVANCVLVFGAMPMSDFGKLTKSAPKKSLLDPYVAQLADANLAVGTVDDLRALVEKLKPEALRRTRAQMAGTGLDEDAVLWLAWGERGKSSEAIFQRMSGVLAPRGDTENKSYPRDAADLARCRKLLEAVPEFAPRIGVMADVSLEWSYLVEQWDELASMMDAEAPDWRLGSGAAQETSQRINEILTAAAAARKSAYKP